MHAAVRVLPVPLNETAAQPAIELPPSVKLTLPVGLLPTTVAVNVTLALLADGFAELASAVVVAVPVGTVTCTVRELEFADTTLMLTPLLLSV